MCVAYIYLDIDIICVHIYLDIYLYTLYLYISAYGSVCVYISMIV